MTDEARGRKKSRRRLRVGLALLAALLAIVVVPPLISVSHYKSRITQLIAESLGRPVRLSSVDVRLLPVPAFELTNLTVDEDPTYGTEPVLRANTVTASIRLRSLWRGRLEIGTVSVDEASLNLVRTAEGRWNLDSLFRTAAAKAQSQDTGAKRAGLTAARGPVPLPYLEATNSRINFKQGIEKLPFSLVNTELSFWQEEPGDWRIRLRGQPARTDLSLNLGDTGVVRLEARAQRAQELRQMPIHVDLEWREAQLGQLTRLVMGFDPGWRGDLTGELHLNGTADAAQIKTRLRAAGVHRAEFAPAEPMDFDASCSFLYHFPARRMEGLACESPLGDGRVRLTGNLPGDLAGDRAGDLAGNGPAAHLSLELDQIPVGAGLDALRTVRSGFAEGLEAKGLVSGKILYTEPAAGSPGPATVPARDLSGRQRGAKVRPAAASPLTGSLTVEGFELSGPALSEPIVASKILVEPTAADSLGTAANGPAKGTGNGTANGFWSTAMQATVTVPAGEATPLVATARLALNGYRCAVHGLVSVGRLKDWAHVAGVTNTAGLDALTGDAATLDLTAQGPWMPAESVLAGDLPASTKAGALSAALPAGPDHLSGTVTLRNAEWKAEYLANPVDLTQATLHVEDRLMRWDPVVFSYGPVEGTATVDLGAMALGKSCAGTVPCAPRVQVQFGELDARAVQAAILGAQEQGTLLSTLLDRFRTTSGDPAPGWPSMDGTIRAASLILGPVTLTNATADVHLAGGDVEIANLQAGLLGGELLGDGTVHAAGGKRTQPSYTLQGRLARLSPAAVGRLLGMSWSGTAMNASGKIEVAGFAAKDLAASAKGTVHIDWQHGGVDEDAADAPAGLPPMLSRFDRWTADAVIGDGAVRLKANQVQLGARSESVDGSVTLADPPKVSLTGAGEKPVETQAQR
jgi:hypothetical protein